MNWFFIDESITDGDRRQGPYSVDDIREFVKQGKITESTLVWRSGEENWKPWNEYEESKDPETTSLEASRDELIRNTIEELLKEQAASRHFAGFFIRLLAYCIDYLFLGLVGGLVLIALSMGGAADLDAIREALVNYINSPTSNEAFDKLMAAPGIATFFSIYGAIQAIYFVVFQAIYSATPGKMLCHIHIETIEGERLGWISSLARYLCSILTQLTLLFYGIGYLVVAIDPKRRALHDWVARTFVVFDKRAKAPKRSKPEQEN